MTTNKKNNLLFISWQPYCSRSDGIAGRLGGKSVMIYSPFWGSHYATIGFKYLSQFVKTLRVLIQQRPKVVFVMTPPVIACFAVWIYACLWRRKFVIDAHTGAFLDDRWKRLIFLHRFFSRRAVTTIVTSRHFKQMIESWGARADIVTDVPLYFPEPTKYPLAGEQNIVLVCSFTYDEPTELFLEAASDLPEIQFYLTGNHEKLDPGIAANKPVNVQFTGFLDDRDYVGLLSGCDAVVALTTCDHTMQRGAYEAIYLQTPVITSDYGILRDAFPKGTVHVKNSREAIAAGIRKMSDNLEQYRTEAVELREEKLQRWNEVATLMSQLLDVDVPSSGSAHIETPQQQEDKISL